MVASAIPFHETTKTETHSSPPLDASPPLESSSEPRTKKPSKQRGVNTARPDYAFEVDDTDHCETPLEAYRGLLDLLNQIASKLGKKRSELIVYDPYYCNGGVQRKLKSLGFVSVINRNRDFYVDIANKTTPDFDVLITNPPYSGVHMEQLLAFCIQNPRKPFLLLLPHYVYTKDYYDRALGAARDDVYFLVPETRYSYVPPKWVTAADGSKALSRGKETTAPFPTFWYCGVDECLVSSQWLTKNFGVSGTVRPKHSSNLRFARVSRDIPRDFKGEFDATKKRPNPKARKRAAKKRRGAAAAQWR